MTTRRRRGEDGISFEHRGPCRDPHRHRHCPGLWRGEITTGYTGDGKRQRRKVSGTTKAAVIDKLRDLRTQLDKGHHPQARLRPLHRPPGRRGLARPRAGGPLPQDRHQEPNVLAPILKVIGARKLRDLTAADVRQALAAMAAGYSTAAVSMGHLALKRAIRHAEASDLVTRNVATLADTPKGQEGRPSKSLTLDQAVAVMTAAATLPVMELRPGLKDVRRPAAADARLHHPEPAVRAPHRRSPGPALGPRRPGRRPGRPPARPPARGRVAVGPRPRRDQDRTVPPHPRPPPRGRPGAARLGRQPGRERLAAGDDWQDTGLVFTSHHGAALDAGNVRKMFKRICAEAGVGDGWTPRELRTTFVSLMSHQGVAIEEIARLAGHATTRTTEIVYRRELRPVITTGAEIMDQLFTGT